MASNHKTNTTKAGGNFDLPKRKPNDGLSEFTAQRQCIYCLIGQCTNTDNDMFHMTGPGSKVIPDDTFLNFVIDNETKLPEKTKPVCHLKKNDEDVNSKGKEEEGPVTKEPNIPCRYCVIGKCTSWGKTDHRFKHILIWYCPLNSKEIARLKTLRDNKNNKAIKEFEKTINTSIAEFEKTKKELERTQKKMIEAIQSNDPDAIKSLIVVEDKDDGDDEEEGLTEVDVEPQRTPAPRIQLNEIMKYKPESAVVEVE